MTYTDHKKALFKILYSIGGFHIAKYFLRKFPRILMYHRFGHRNSSRMLSVSVFEEQIKILLKRFNVISLKSLYSSLANGEPISPNTVVLTIDDGYEDFYKYAFPVLKKYSIPATIYVTTGFIDKKTWLWPDVIEFVLNRTKYNNYSLILNGGKEIYNIGNKKDRLRAWNDVADYCLTLKNKEKNVFLEQFADDLGVSVSSSPVSEYGPLSWEQIREIKRYNLDVGSHTCTHPRLVMEEYYDVLHEIRESKKRIEIMTDETVDSFCYPHGMRTDFNDDIKRMVKDAGYKNATVAYFDLNITDDLFALKRYGISNDMLYFNKVIYGIEFLSTAQKTLIGKT